MIFLLLLIPALSYPFYSVGAAEYGIRAEATLPIHARLIPDCGHPNSAAFYCEQEGLCCENVEPAGGTVCQTVDGESLCGTQEYALCLQHATKAECNTMIDYYQWDETNQGVFE